MPYTPEITKFAQDVRLVTHNRFFEDIEEEDGQVYIAQIVSATNMLAGELEQLVDAVNEPVVWNWLRRMDYSLGVAVEGAKTLTLPTEIQSIVAEEGRFIEILSPAGNLISRWSVVYPDQIRKDPTAWRHRENRVARVGTELVFSRPFNDKEDGMEIVGDVSLFIPRMTDIDDSCLTIVQPKELLTLGVAKNVTLPDIVQGPLSPSYVQKYQDLLQQAITRNRASTRSEIAPRENLSYVRGIY